MQPVNKESKSLDVKLLESVTMNGQEAIPGAVITLPELSANALVKEGRAEHVAESGQNEPPSNDNETNDAKEPGEGKAQEDGKESVLTAKALDDQYEDLDELKEAAKAVGVNFAWNAKKETVIANALEQGKAEALLKKQP